MFKALITHSSTPFDDANNRIFDGKVESKLAESVDEDYLAEQVEDCDALCVVYVYAKATQKVIESAKRLKVIARYGVGTDNIDLKAATELGVVVTNCPQYHLPTMPEHVIALLFALARKITIADRSVRDGRWNHEEAFGRDIEGKTLGILGLGKIGSLVAKKAMALGMNVVGHDSYLDADQIGIEGLKVTGFNSVIEQADFLSVNVPLCNDTINLIDADIFDKMKKDAYLINTSRGPVVDEEALYDALVNKSIAGAALDVMATEPPDKKHKLFGLDNVIITPHCGGSTVEALQRLGITAAKSVVDVLEGRKPESVCNMEVLKKLNLSRLR